MARLDWIWRSTRNKSPGFDRSTPTSGYCLLCCSDLGLCEHMELPTQTFPCLCTFIIISCYAVQLILKLSTLRSRSLSLLCCSRSHSSLRSSTRDFTDKDALFFRLGMRTPDFTLIPTVRTGLRGEMRLIRRGSPEKSTVIGPRSCAG
jgi:hypothetical protein